MAKYVLVRSKDAGVFAGEIVDRDNSTVTLANARRIWRWDTRNDAVKAYTLSDVSKIGAGSDGLVSEAVSEIIVNGWCEIIPCTTEGEKAIREAKPWK